VWRSLLISAGSKELTIGAELRRGIVFLIGNVEGYVRSIVGEAKMLAIENLLFDLIIGEEGSMWIALDLQESIILNDDWSMDVFNDVDEEEAEDGEAAKEEDNFSNETDDTIGEAVLMSGIWFSLLGIKVEFKGKHSDLTVHSIAVDSEAAILWWLDRSTRSLTLNHLYWPKHQKTFDLITINQQQTRSSKKLTAFWPSMEKNRKKHVRSCVKLNGDCRSIHRFQILKLLSSNAVYPLKASHTVTFFLSFPSSIA
jgi:hypothetical protein